MFIASITKHASALVSSEFTNFSMCSYTSSKKTGLMDDVHSVRDRGKVFLYLFMVFFLENNVCTGVAKKLSTARHFQNTYKNKMKIDKKGHT